MQLYVTLLNYLLPVPIVISNVIVCTLFDIEAATQVT